MAANKEASLSVKKFFGVNRNAEPEDLVDGEHFAVKNLWEKTLGTLETRWNTDNFVSSLPSNITGIDKVTKLYKGTGGAVRMAAIHCTEDIEEPFALPAGMSLSFTNAVDRDAGNWNTNYSWDGANTFTTIHMKIYIMFYGYGVHKVHSVLPSAISGYSTASQQILNINVSQPLDPNITGFEVYVKVNNGGISQEPQVWVGSFELVTAQTGTFQITHVPPGAHASTPNIDIGNSKRNFTVRASASGGNLPGGKTYYVYVLPYWFKKDAFIVNCRAAFYASAVDIAQDIVAVSLPEGSTGQISIQLSPPSTIGALFLIGEDPRLLQPVKAVYSTDGLGTSISSVSIKDLNKYSPALINLTFNVSQSSAIVQYLVSDYSLQDMLLGINDNGTYFPIFCSNLHDVNADSRQDDEFDNGLWGNVSDTQLAAIDFEDLVRVMGKAAKYNFVQFGNISFFVNNQPAKFRRYLSTFFLAPVTLDSKTYSNYFMTDGNICSPVVEDYRATSITLPNNKFIAIYEDSIILGGGEVATDEQAGGTMDTSQAYLYSRAANPYDFTIAGSSPAQFQQISVKDDQDSNLTGLGIYTATTTSSGPQSRLIVAKQKSIHLQGALPDVSGGVITGSGPEIISSASGVVNQDTIVSTEIGTIVCGINNVYLLRGVGEPGPVGQQISEILKGADLSRASACYHDRHYKLAFYHPDYPGTSGYNNVEFWLNINKVIEQKGQPDWVGPMLGAKFDYCFVEDNAGDGQTYNTARDRIAVDRQNIRLLKLDVKPLDADVQCDDLSTVIESEIETKEFSFGEELSNWNKLLKRLYVNVRTNTTSGSPMTGTIKLYADGSLVDTIAVSFYGGSASFYSAALKLNRVFPSTRVRGRTLKLVFTTSNRIGLGGYQLNAQLERRRL